ncbi:MAG: flavin reductase [Campylobacteraceae bacterium]
MQQTVATSMSNAWISKKPSEFSGSPIDRFNKEWALATAGKKDDYNTMTISWGTIGYLWERPVAFLFVRPYPSRYTHKFTEKYSHFTLTFFDKSLKTKVHKICGNKSGQDIDKAKEAGITPIYLGSEDIVSFEEAKDILVCKKIYTGRFDPEKFLDPSIENLYPIKDYHQVYIGEIEKYYTK